MKRSTEKIWIDGLIAGMIGYAVLALFFAVSNALAGRSPFFTAAVLGEAMFYGLRDVNAVTLAPGPIIAYNGIHLVVFLLIGFGVAWTVNQLERHPDLSYFAFVLAFAGFLGSYALALIFGGPIAVALPWQLVAGANFTAGMAMATYLWWTHPLLRSELQTGGEATEPEERLDLRGTPAVRVGGHQRR